jgi:hypothetical protein
VFDADVELEELGVTEEVTVTEPELVEVGDEVGDTEAVADAVNVGDLEDTADTVLGTSEGDEDTVEVLDTVDEADTEEDTDLDLVLVMLTVALDDTDVDDEDDFEAWDAEADDEGVVEGVINADLVKV